MQSFHDLKNFISLRKKGDSFQLFHAIFSQRSALLYREQKWAGLGIFSSLFLFQAKFFLHIFLSFRTEAETCRATPSLKIPTV